MRDFIKERSLDIAVGVIFATVFAALIDVRGDVLFIGLWYYLTALGGAFVVALLANPRPFFAGGAVMAAGLSLALYVWVNGHPATRSGLLGIAHLLSLPGAAVGIVVFGIVSRRRKWRRESWLFFAGFLGFFLGFAINQIGLFMS